jgi:hypothetical protein
MHMAVRCKPSQYLRPLKWHSNSDLSHRQFLHDSISDYFLTLLTTLSRSLRPLRLVRIGKRVDYKVTWAQSETLDNWGNPAEGGSLRGQFGLNLLRKSWLT